MACGRFTSQKTKTSIGETHKTPSSCSYVYVLWTQISPFWIIHSLQPHQIFVGRQTSWTSKFYQQIGKRTDYQSWSRLTLHYHSIQVIPVNISPVSHIRYTNLHNYISNYLLMYILSFLLYKMFVIFIVVCVLYHNAL